MVKGTVTVISALKVKNDNDDANGNDHRNDKDDLRHGSVTSHDASATSCHASVTSRHASVTSIELL